MVAKKKKKKAAKKGLLRLRQLLRQLVSRRVVFGAVLGALAFVALVNVAVVIGGSSFESSEKRSTTSPVSSENNNNKSFDCALVLGAGVQPDGTPSWVLRDRLEEALSLYRAGRVKRILVSGDHRTNEYDEPNAMRTWLEAHGAPASEIFMDHAGVDTYSSVWRAKHVFGASRLIIVTQRFHLPRAVWMARSMGMTAEGAVADRRLYRGAVWFEAREVISRTKAFVDVTVDRTPHHAGPAISLDGDGRVTAG